MTENPEDIDTLRQSLLHTMATLEIEELPQDRLERMFAYYNAHWSEYYGTDRTFTLE